MKLWIVRHAKSSWGNPGLSDFDRPLNARGERDGPRMVAWLAKQPHPARWLWTSTAHRAMQTADYVQQAFDVPSERRVELDELYHASPEVLLDCLRRTPDDADSVAVVAHNPGVTYLVNLLGADPVTDNLPTFGVARFDCPGAWADLQPGTCRLETLVTPKTIA